MKLRELTEEGRWKGRKTCKKRFLNTEKKHSSENFDPSDLPKPKRLDEFEEEIDSLANPDRLKTELNHHELVNNRANDSSYQFLVLKYGILNYLVRQPEYTALFDEVKEEIPKWEEKLAEEFSKENFEKQEQEDEFYFLTKAIVSYPTGDPEIRDAELNLLARFMEMKNQNMQYKSNYYTWMDFFRRAGSETLKCFPKINDPEPHAESTVKDTIYGLEEQGLIFDVNNADGDRVIGIPEEFVPTIKEWLNFELVEEDYRELLDSIDQFNQPTLVDIKDEFDLPAARRNDKRKKYTIDGGVIPSDAMKIAYEEGYRNLQSIVKDDPAIKIDATSSKEELIDAIIKRYEGSHRDEEKSEWELYLDNLEEISNLNIEEISTALLQDVDTDKNEKQQLQTMFEDATNAIFRDVLGWDVVKRGQGTGKQPDGQVNFDEGIFLWDTKAAEEEFDINTNTVRQVKDYVRDYEDDHNVEAFIIITSDYGG